MKLKENFTLYTMADEHMLIPVGDAVGSFGGVIALNDVSAFILSQMQKEPKTKEQLLAALTSEYEVDAETAGKDLNEILQKFESFGVLEQ